MTDDAPTMPDPPEDEDDYLPQIASVPLFERTPEPPKAASVELALMLSGVSDPQDRQRIVDTYHDATEGLDGELLAQYGALFAAILRAYEARQEKIVGALLPILAAMQKAAKQSGQGTAAAPQGEAITPEDMGEIGRSIADTILQGQAAKLKKIQLAATAANWRGLVISCVASFFAGAFFLAALWIVFHH